MALRKLAYNAPLDDLTQKIDSRQMRLALFKHFN